MRDTLELALTDVVGPEQLQVILDAATQLETCGLSAPSDDLQTVIEIQDAMSDNALLVSRVNDILYLAYEEAFASLGVTVDDEATLAFKTALLDAITSLDYYIIPEQIQLLYQAPFTNEEIVAHLMPIFTPYDLELAVMWITQVSDATIARLKEVIDAKVQLNTQADVQSPKDNAARLSRLNRLIKLVGAEQVSAVYTLAQAGVRAGRPLDALLTQLLPQLEGLEPEHVTSELYAVLLFSDTPLDALKSKNSLMALINDFEEDLGRQRRMDLVATRLHQQLEITP